MNGELDNQPMMSMLPPTALEAAQAVRDAQRQYRRVLASWACDTLRLRRRGVHCMRWRSDAQSPGFSKAA